MRRDQARQRPQKGALARPVWADHGHDLAGGQRRQAQPLHNGPSAVTGAQFLNLKTPHARPPLRKISSRKTGTPITAVTMPTGISTPGTMALDAAEASDMMIAPERMLAGRKKR
ncbi:hypothetical protein D3C75_813150 [compost metagenome]